jgi:diguanylate cyclase (GGDEF)-like protein
LVASAPIPIDEAERVEALRGYHILDTAPDERFDLFTKLSTWLYDVPLAAINFVDSDRTFFKSIIGLSTYEPKRITSLCAHTVGSGDDIMVVPNLAQDSRFENHPFVAKGIQFYAGAVLRSSSGHAIGTLCICDVEPRAFSEADQDRLKQMAKGVGAVLELHRNGSMLLEAATRDSLTGLWNRRLMMQRLEDVLPTASTNQPCTLLYLDLDRFKAVNDRFGHPGGDAVLCEVARRLVGVARSDDIVVRVAGDEFVILLRPGSNPNCAEEIADRALAAFAAPFAIQGASVPIGCSIGIASSPSHARDPDGLIGCADSALYQAKQSGRSCWRTFGSCAAEILFSEKRSAN